jgi:protease I
MAQNLEGKRIAILATDGFEQAELIAPRKALVAEGAETVVIAPKSGEIQGFTHHDKADKLRVDQTLEQAKPETFDGLLLPGGALNPDALRMDPKAVAFVRSFAAAGKPIAAICHGPWTLVEADVVRDRTLTSWPSLKTDLRNAGAQWVDQEVVQDGNLVTSRKPDDIPAFTAAAIGIFKTGKRGGNA